MKTQIDQIWVAIQKSTQKLAKDHSQVVWEDLGCLIFHINASTGFHFLTGF